MRTKLIIATALAHHVMFTLVLYAWFKTEGFLWVLMAAWNVWSIKGCVEDYENFKRIKAEGERLKQQYPEFKDFIDVS